MPSESELRKDILALLAECRRWPKFIEHEAEIGQALAVEPYAGSLEAEGDLLSAIYRNVVGSSGDF